MENTELFEKKIDVLSAEIIALRESVSAGFVKANNNFNVIAVKLAALERQVNELNFKVDKLDTTTSVGFGEVGTKIESLTDEISKINAVTNYDDQYNNLKIIR